MTALQNVDQAEVELRDHCQANHADGAVTYTEDSKRLEDMAEFVVALSKVVAPAISKLHSRDNPNPTPVGDVARLVAEALDRDLSQPAAALLCAQVEYLLSKPETVAV
jgi:hypothetical protein